MAAKKSKKDNKTDNTIAVNRQATHEYYIEEQFEAGLVLEGWEVKSLRDGRVQLKESYVEIRRGEAWLCGAHVSPLLTASTHIIPDAVGSVERKGFTLIPLSMYWIKSRAKLKIGLAKGKKLHDKRATAKDKDWQRDKARIMKHA
jgi:SsrA-binding protein